MSGKRTGLGSVDHDPLPAIARNAKYLSTEEVDP